MGSMSRVAIMALVVLAGMLSSASSEPFERGHLFVRDGDTVIKTEDAFTRSAPLKTPETGMRTKCLAEIEKGM